MRAVHSWLRELVPGLPDAHACADALTEAGLKVESVELLGAGDSGHRPASWSARSSTIEELTEFKKPIRFVEVRVADGRPAARDRLRRNEFRGRRPGARRAARRRAARWLRDRCAGDVRPRVRRDDLLGPRARARR